MGQLSRFLLVALAISSAITLVIVLLLLFVNKKYPLLPSKQASPTAKSDVTSQLPSTVLVYVRDNKLFYKDISTFAGPEEKLLWKGEQVTLSDRRVFAGVSASKKYLVFFNPPNSFELYDLSTKAQTTIPGLSSWVQLSTVGDFLIATSLDKKLVRVNLPDPQLLTLAVGRIVPQQISPDGKAVLATEISSGGQRFVVFDLENGGKEIYRDDRPARRLLLSKETLIVAKDDGLYSQTLSKGKQQQLLVPKQFAYYLSLAVTPDARTLFALTTDKAWSTPTLNAFDMVTNSTITTVILKELGQPEKISQQQYKILPISATAALIATSPLRQQQVTESMTIWYVDIATGKSLLYLDKVKVL